MAFSFGMPTSTSAPGVKPAFSFSTPATAATTSSTSGFSFAAPASSAAPLFSFSKPVSSATTSTASTAFSFSQPANTSTVSSSSSGFSFKTEAPSGSISTPTTGSFAPKLPATTAPTLSFGMSSIANTTSSTTGFSFAKPGQTTASTSSGGLSFTSTPTVTTASLGLATTVPQVSTSSTGFAFAKPSATTTAPSFSFTNTPAATSAPSGTGFSFAKPLTTVATTVAPVASGFSLSPKTTAVATPVSTSAPSFGFNAPKATVTPSTSTGFNLPSLATSTSSAAPAFSQTATQNAVTTFGQLETFAKQKQTQLDNNERIFLEQAASLNVFDEILTLNQDRLNEINSADGILDKIKKQQVGVGQELDFLDAQHTEMNSVVDELLEALDEREKMLKNAGLLAPQSFEGSLGGLASSHAKTCDDQRTKIYDSVSRIDSQLKKGSKHLESLVSRLNAMTGFNEESVTNASSSTQHQLIKVINHHKTQLDWLQNNVYQMNNVVNQIQHPSSA